MAKTEGSLHWYLDKYYEIQDKILLCYRPTLESAWSDRCLYLEEKYEPTKEYNHRSILLNEVVIEFDDKSVEENRKNALVVNDRLRKAGFITAVWTSGNKSTHVHTFVDVAAAKNVSLLKNCFIRHFSKNLPLPDIRLCADNHLVRAEWGVNEKTGEKKKKLSQDKEYPLIKRIPQEVWDRYNNEMKILMQRRMTMNLNDIETLPGFQYVLKTDEFRNSDDGRERALFMLIHTLKHKYANEKEKLVTFLQDWYAYSGGHKLTPNQIRNKVLYQWDKPYKPGKKYLDELLESVGREDLIK